MIWDKNRKECDVCKGTGEVTECCGEPHIEDCECDPGAWEPMITCDTCSGTGEVELEKGDEE